MKTLADPVTGELVEVIPEQLVGPAEPYDYAGYRRAVLAATTEHRAAVADLLEKEKAAGSADANYRKLLALGMLAEKVEHGATVAEQLAKGRPEVVKAYEDRLAAEARARAAMEKVRLCRDDRVALSAMGGWSREADPDGWRA